MSFKEFGALLEEALPSPSERSKPRPAELPTVLLIDDDKSIRESLHCLMSSHYNLVICESAVEGVNAFHDEVTAVILDVKMDMYDGFWACDQIRKKQADVPVIFYSAYQKTKNPFDIINQHRPFGYITKDGDPKKLLETLETAVLLYRTVIRSRRLMKSLKHRPQRNRDI